MNAKFTALAAAIGLALAACSSGPSTRQAPVSGSSSIETKESQTVRQAQRQLNQKGFDVETDGLMGPKTSAALREFQQQQGMQASGNLDQKTIAALGTEGQQSSMQMQDSQTVLQAQRQLTQKGYDVEADGVIGPKTRTALREYQQREGIEASGNLDQRTMTTLGRNR